MFSIAAFIIALGILVFIHEAGHFLVARKLSIGVEKFSLGFGPKIFSKKIDDTEYLLSAIPLGGYVKLLGEDPNEKCEDSEHAFSSQPVWKRFSVVAAGPIFNFFLTLVLFPIIFMVGLPLHIYGTTIGEVIKGSPAMEGGIIKGDKILSIDSIEISKWEELKTIISTNPNKKLKITVRRKDNNSPIILHVTPKSEKYFDMLGDEHEEGRIGIIPSGDETIETLEKYPPIEAIFKGVEKTYSLTKLMTLGIFKMIQGNVSSKEIGGPILIGQMAGQQAKLGLMPYLYFLAFISINLGILNLFPIPILDGGHLLFFTLEAIKGKPVSEKIREIAQQIGLFMLASLLLLATYNDIMRSLDGIINFFKKIFSIFQ